MIKNISSGLAIAALVVGLSACKQISMEQYVDVMADLGCNGVTELDAKAQEIFKKHGVTEKDIDKFRRNLKRDQIKPMADQIVAKVAACHGVDLKALGQPGQGQPQAAQPAPQQ